LGSTAFVFDQLTWDLGERRESVRKVGGVGGEVRECGDEGESRLKGGLASFCSGA